MLRIMCKILEDLFITKLYRPGILRYAETNSDMDMANKFAYTKKGPNSLGANDARRIPIRQRILHPSMLGCIEIANCSNSDPGQGGALSPYCDMKSMYFDDSLYENQLHYKLSKYMDKYPLDDDYEELVIQCDNETEYNSMLDALYHAGEGKFKICGVSNNPMEIIIEKDPRENYRKFDEEEFLAKEKPST